MPVDNVKEYWVRRAARAIVVDENNLIGLMHVSKEKYYKLPGGGVKKTEGIKKALKRECLEEIGSDIEIVSEIGSITEYRKLENMKQVSYCYLTKIKGKKGSPNFTKKEISKGFESVWLPYLEALEIISKNEATSDDGKLYIVPRDIIFLKEAIKSLDKLI